MRRESLGLPSIKTCLVINVSMINLVVTNLGAGAEVVDVGHFVVKERINLSFPVYEAPN